MGGGGRDRGRGRERSVRAAAGARGGTGVSGAGSLPGSREMLCVPAALTWGRDPRPRIRAEAVGAAGEVAEGWSSSVTTSAPRSESQASR